MTNLIERKLKVQVELEQRYGQAAILIVTADCHFRINSTQDFCEVSKHRIVCQEKKREADIS
jgi:hypothetical protein